jgi:hypothetical protein
MALPLELRLNSQQRMPTCRNERKTATARPEPFGARSARSAMRVHFRSSAPRGPDGNNTARSARSMTKIPTRMNLSDSDIRTYIPLNVPATADSQGTIGVVFCGTDEEYGASILLAIPRMSYAIARRCHLPLTGLSAAAAFDTAQRLNYGTPCPLISQNVSAPSSGSAREN